MRSGGCVPCVYFALLSVIGVPVLAVSHRDDGCPCSPGTAKAGAKLRHKPAGPIGCLTGDRDWG
jgi:hypothetical protein